MIGGIQFIPSGLNFVVDAPSTATAGTAFNFTVTTRDASNNVMPGHTGTVRFTSTDTTAVLPADATLTNGVGTFSATLWTEGSQTLAATDTAISTITGASGIVAVSKKATTIVLTAAQNAVIAGNPVTFTATVAGDPPTGSVSFADNGTSLACSPATLVPGTTSSTASCTASFTGVGLQPITATYLGDANFASATSLALAVSVEASTQSPVPVPVFDRWMVWFLISLMGAIYWPARKSLSDGARDADRSRCCAASALR